MDTERTLTIDAGDGPISISSLGLVAALALAESSADPAAYAVELQPLDWRLGLSIDGSDLPEHRVRFEPEELEAIVALARRLRGEATP